MTQQNTPPIFVPDFETLRPEYERLRATWIDFTMDGFTAMILVGALQLALRHPAYPETIRPTVAKATENIINGIRQISPTIAMTCDLGWDPIFDVETEKENDHE